MTDRIALYMRLSKEDGIGESNSIRMQRQLLLGYVRAHWKAYDCLEFADDGYSGTNFERPALNRLLQKAGEHQLDCIVVKDFSRFSRDYLELGRYLEQIFPAWQVRFVSVNDGFDSAKLQGNTLSMDTGFRHLLCDLYSKDISQKVKSALSAKKNTGIYVSANCPFGYVKDSKNRHKLLIREEEARVVRCIFSLAQKGFGATQIARFCNRKAIKTPMAFQVERGETARIPKGDCFFWTNGMVTQILKNPVYTGDMVQGKYQKEAVGGKNHKKAAEDFLVCQNYHEPIITRELYDSLQQKKKKTTSSKKQKRAFLHPLIGKVVCGCCGRNLRYRDGRDSYFGCQTRYSTEQEECIRRVSCLILEETVLYRMACEDVWKERKDMPGAISKELVDSYVEKVIVYDEQTISIRWLQAQSYNTRGDSFTY